MIRLFRKKRGSSIIDVGELNKKRILNLNKNNDFNTNITNTNQSRINESDQNQSSELEKENFEVLGALANFGADNAGNGSNVNETDISFVGSKSPISQRSDNYNNISRSLEVSDIDYREKFERLRRRFNSFVERIELIERKIERLENKLDLRH